jgi:chromosome segregation protein
MRLNCIKLAGFKSFVDPTTVHFPSNMAAVVGPNGCGKSNVIDAVRWVMGESSAKTLRGESMADVIFNGSVNRQPVGQASIELVFDNSESRIGGEYAAYTEISVRRQVSREGQSEYFLNGTRCRRRDITDIFLGTGLGPRSYAIIEQGMISRLIESRPEELRVFIEEAAGISRYKERRKETESRMRRTLENLERLTDLRDELERQLSHLQRQAQAAEKYSEFKQEERELKAQLHALQWRELDAEIGACSRGVAELEVKLEGVRAEHQQVDTAIEQHRVEHSARSDTLNEVQGRYYALGAEVARIEQTIKLQLERGRQLGEDLQQTRDSLVESERHLAEDSGKLENWERERDTLAPELETLQSAEQVSAQALLTAEQSMHDWQQQWDEFNQHAAEPRQQAEVQQSRIQHLEQVLSRLQSRAEQLLEEKQTLGEGPAGDGMAGVGEELAELELQMAEREKLGERVGRDISDTRERAAAVAAELDSARSALQRLRGRHASLEALQQSALEDAGAAVSEWLERNGLSQRPRLVEQLEVEEGWQTAVETALGDYLQAVCVERIEASGATLATLQQGTVALVEPAPGGHAPADCLAAKVRGAGPSLLAGIRVAYDLEQALGLRQGLASHESVITPDGVWLGPDWLRLSRLGEEQGGMIRRQRELEQLVSDLASGEERVGTLEAEQLAARETLAALEQQRTDNQRELQASTRRHAELSARLSAHRAKQEQIAARRERMNRELDEAREQYRQEQESLGAARVLLSEAIERMESDSHRREELLSLRDSARRELDAARQRARHDKDAAHQLAMRHQSLQTQLESIRGSIERTRAQVAQLSERRAGLEHNLSENDSPLQRLEQELEQQLQLRLAAEGDLGEARQAVSGSEHALRECERERAQVEQRSAAVRNELEQRRLRQQALQVQLQTVRAQLDDSGHVLDEVLESLPEDAARPDWQQALERVAGRISRLGPINLAAIDEYRLQAERKQYLDAQHEDLTTALETLESAIRKIDKETRNRFRDTFDKVNAGLQELFPRVFGGGSAYLEMTGEDLLDTGIAIMARPPGKKNSTIHLLSGGEKALTAIALVFSIFQLNPAPFCMLDEVDAPLDDANTGRYARMVKEMSEKVQFIFITHNKISMEQADQLLGVTMHEPGVSRLVSVDVDEAVRLAAVS